jgi:DNA repair exonuclease SbcCD ATPase subunit
MNTNEIQIRLTADIKALQSALTKAQKSLQDFEAKNAAETEKSNKGKERQLGLIEKLNKEAQKLKTSITQATSKEDIAKFNAELEQTKKRLSQLNALGKSSSTPVGLINNLNLQLKTLKKSIASATDEKDVARLNAELKKTQDELQRINALGRNITAPAVKSFTQLKSSVGAANGSAVAFNRIIQDAPFGLLGVGNNIQQFTEQIAFLKKDLGSTSAAVKSFFGSLFSSTNLLILGVSAVTSAFTAYQMGAFDSAEETKELKTEAELLSDSLNRLKSSLSDVDSARLKGNQNAADELVKFKLLKQAIDDVKKPNEERIKAFETLKKLYPDIIGSMTSEQALAGQLSTSYNKINESIRDRAKAQGIYEVLVEIEKESAELQLQSIKQALFKNKLLADEARLQKEVADLTDLVNRKNARGNTSQSAFNESLRNAQTELANVQSELKLLNDVVAPGTTKALNENEDAASQLESQFAKTADAVEIFTEKSKKLQTRTKEIIPDIKLDRPDITGLGVELPELDIKGNEGYIQQIQARIEAITQLKDASRNLAEIFAFNLQLGLLQNQLASLNGEEVKSNLEIITDAFGSMGAGIAASLNISNRALRGFVTTLISATPKIISAIMAQADAKTKGAAVGVVADKKESLSGGIKLGVKAAEALGPVGLALLPVFIAGAVALISGAFSKIGGGGGGGSVSAGTGSTFTNREFGGPVSKGRAYIVGERRPELFVPNTNGIIVPQLPSMDYSGASMAAGAMAVDVNIRGVSYGDDILFTVQQAQIRQGIR